MWAECPISIGCSRVSELVGEMTTTARPHAPGPLGNFPSRPWPDIHLERGRYGRYSSSSQEAVFYTVIDKLFNEDIPPYQMC